MIQLKMKLKESKGFTLIEIVIVMVILGILAIVAVPKFVDLTTSAKTSATQAALGAVRSVLAVQYAKNAAGGNPAFPGSLAGTDFASDTLPINKITGDTGIGTLDAAAGGTATHDTDGFWYVVATGVAGAYSDGTTNTSTW